MKNIVIDVVDVQKSFKPGKIKVHALRDINFTVCSKEFVILFGPSGAGKTTILDLVAGLDTPDSGRIIFRGEDITKFDDLELARYRSTRIGVVFQDFSLVSNMNAVENVALPLVFANYRKKDREMRAKNLLSELGLSRRFNHKPYELSGGEQQRVAIARALINNPWMLLIDEPTGDLDSKNAADIIQLIVGLNRISKRTILMVTHNSEYLQYANRILKIKDGKILNS
jgi:putative ABC transport system ATP-binding protein